MLSPLPRDSDGDGYTNIQEMLAGTDKADPCDPNPECAACLAITPAATPTATATPTPTPTEEVPGFEAVFANFFAPQKPKIGKCRGKFFYFPCFLFFIS
jgi:hypothetical protein